MRMRLPAAELPETRLRGPASPLRGQAAGVNETAGLSRDAQIGHIFRNMRSATRLPREALARRLATTPSTIEDLENGALSSLPHWRETVRIVRGYCEILRLDPQPILWRMQSQWESSHADPPTRSNGTRPPGPAPAALRRDAGKSRPAARVRRRARTMFALSAPLVLAAGAFYVAQAAPAPIYRAIALLPQAVAGTARAGMDNLVLYSAPRRDGLKWIDVGDPQLRKVDKLQTSSR
jgi:transcriptional regulator with XRE-family HTH domain